MAVTWESWDAWEPDAALGGGEALLTQCGPTQRGYYEQAATELNAVGSWGSWHAHAEETASWFDPTEEATTTYTPPPTPALFERASLSGEDTDDSYVKTAAPANQKRPISQNSLVFAFDEPVNQESSSAGSKAAITCPNCGEAKGSKGTWCRSAKCVSRREAVAAGKGKKSLYRADSSTVFQCDEPSYQTPPSVDVGPRNRTGPGAPFYGTITAAPDGQTIQSQRPTDWRETTQRQPEEQYAAPEVRASPAPNASPSDNFYAEVAQLQEAAGTPFVKVPTVGMKTLDLFVLYQEVAKRGGMHEVVSKKLWKAVAATLQLPTTCTDYGFRLRRHYERYLLAYERKHLGTVPPQKKGTTNRTKRKQRSERANRQAGQEQEEWVANPYSKRAYYRA